jgi:hypothetical protein
MGWSAESLYLAGRSVGYYNTFVTNDAITQAGGIGNNVLYGSTVLTWTAIASTNDVSAISSVGAFDVPVYRASGTLIASDPDERVHDGSILLRYECLDVNVAGWNQRLAGNM